MAGASSKSRRRMLHRAAAGRVQVADAGGEGVEACAAARRRRPATAAARGTRGWGSGCAGVAAREGAQLRRRHAHRAAALAAAYSRPIMRLAPAASWPCVLSVFTPCTLKTARICRWSCRFSPTPGSVVHAPRCRAAAAARRARCPRAAGSAASRSRRRTGSPRARRVRRAPCSLAVPAPGRRCSAARRRLGALDHQPRDLRAGPQLEVGPRRSRSGRRKALAVFQRQPRCWLTSK